MLICDCRKRRATGDSEEAKPQPPLVPAVDEATSASSDELQLPPSSSSFPSDPSDVVPTQQPAIESNPRSDAPTAVFKGEKFGRTTGGKIIRYLKFGVYPSIHTYKSKESAETNKKDKSDEFSLKEAVVEGDDIIVMKLERGGKQTTMTFRRAENVGDFGSLREFAKAIPSFTKGETRL
jgi:hypothetical protein